MKVMSQ